MRSIRRREIASSIMSHPHLPKIDVPRRMSLEVPAGEVKVERSRVAA